MIFLIITGKIRLFNIFFFSTNYYCYNLIISFILFNFGSRKEFII